MNLRPMSLKDQKSKTGASEKSLYLLGWILLAACICFYYLITNTAVFQNMPCIFRLATGFYCPGCGATRALYLLCHGQIPESFLYFPAVPYGAAMYLWFMVSHTAEYLSKGRLPIGLAYRNLYLYAALILILGNWVIKNLLLIFF